MPKVSPPAEHGRLLNQRAMLEMKRSKPLPPEEGAMATDVNYKPVDLCQAYRLLPGPRPLGGVNLELEPRKCRLQFSLPRRYECVNCRIPLLGLRLAATACRASHAYPCSFLLDTRTLVIVGKHVLQLCTPRHSYIYQARGAVNALCQPGPHTEDGRQEGEVSHGKIS